MSATVHVRKHAIKRECKNLSNGELTPGNKFHALRCAYENDGGVWATDNMYADELGANYLLIE